MSRRSLLLASVCPVWAQDPKFSTDEYHAASGRETGGAFFQVSDAQPIAKTYAQIEETLRNQYALEFTPQTAGPSGR